jgi:hypothetical protein
MTQNLCAKRAARLALRGVVMLGVVAMASCGDGKNLHKVYPVKGKILVNGQPAHECQVYLNRTFDDNHAFRTTPHGLTDKNGEYQITSYYANDGAPEGEYVVTIEWRERSGVTKQDFEGVDQLGGAYAKVEKTKSLPGFVVKVERQPLELPAFELTQSSEAKRRLEEAKKRRPGFDGHGPLGSGDR